MRHIIIFIVALLFSAGVNAQQTDAADSLLHLGEKYYNLRQYKTAVKYYREAGDLGNVEGAYKAAICYMNGYGVDSNVNTAQKYFKVASDGGNVDAMVMVGHIARNKSNYKEALHYFNMAAMKGDATAMHSLGNLYALGNGVKEDSAKAFEWWEKAAEGGNVDAQAQLGRCYLIGEGIEADADKAVKWLTKAADSDDAESAYYLATYLENTGYTNYVDIAYYYMVAANQGIADAQASLGLLYWEGKGVDRSEIKAADWFMEAARRGNNVGIYNIGYCYYLGKGVPQNKEKGREYFRIAAAHGNTQAKDILQNLK